MTLFAVILAAWIGCAVGFLLGAWWAAGRRPITRYDRSGG